MNTKVLTLTKIQERNDALHPNNIHVGFVKQAIIDGNSFQPPKVGERFWVDGGWSTSAVQEILSPNIFRTYNSVYRWELTGFQIKSYDKKAGDK